MGASEEDKKIVVVKGVVQPRPAYGPMPSKIIRVNTPGVTTSDLPYFDYRRRPSPLFPFEREAADEQFNHGGQRHPDGGIAMSDCARHPPEGH